jgi:hypothetical protein
MVLGDLAPLEETASPRQTIAFRNESMRLIFFAAATNEGEPAFDGVRIEPVAPAAPAPKKPKAKKPAAAAKPKPAAPKP